MQTEQQTKTSVSMSNKQHHAAVPDGTPVHDVLTDPFQDSTWISWANSNTSIATVLPIRSLKHVDSHGITSIRSLAQVAMCSGSALNKDGTAGEAQNHHTNAQISSLLGITKSSKIGSYPMGWPMVWGTRIWNLRETSTKRTFLCPWQECKY